MLAAPNVPKLKHRAAFHSSQTPAFLMATAGTGQHSAAQTTARRAGASAPRGSVGMTGGSVWKKPSQPPPKKPQESLLLRLTYRKNSLNFISVYFERYLFSLHIRAISSVRARSAISKESLAKTACLAPCSWQQMPMLTTTDNPWGRATSTPTWQIRVSIQTPPVLMQMDRVFLLEFLACEERILSNACFICRGARWGLSPIAPARSGAGGGHLGSPSPGHWAPSWARGWAEVGLGHQPGSSWWGPWPSRAGLWGGGQGQGRLVVPSGSWQVCLLGSHASTFHPSLRFLFFSTFIKGKERNRSAPIWTRLGSHATQRAGLRHGWFLIIKPDR